MRDQWQKFLDENASSWSYSVVPDLVKQLDKAIKREDAKLFHMITLKLSWHGITLDRKGDLCFMSDLLAQ